jgi:predicted RNA binding protein YcfA (HicA-like mRNA interferase family)
MFSSFGTAKGAMKWEDFVKAMADAGCSACYVGGSAVTFQYDRNKIQIHHPHPDPSIKPIILRSIGKQLTKRFGWDMETFVDRGKEAA